jgi:UDP-N-acetylmuramoyl-tripeptide--D-alanyl-D-alanine ligase
MMDLYEIFLKYPHICTDTRAIVPNSIFFALKGDNFNANAFAAQALKKGCAFAVVDEAQYAENEQFILVDDVLKTLQDLAQMHRQTLGTTVIGITGTNGKTTTKELIASVLREKFNVLYTQGNLNNHIGVPLTLLQLTENHEIAVIEMGANHPKEIEALAAIATPDYGIITNVGKAHLEGFGSFEGVMRTKSELYVFIAKHGCKIFINEDNPFLAQMAENAGIFVQQKNFYSIKNSKSNIYGTVLDCSPFLKMNFVIENTSFGVATKLIGAYNAENVAAAVCIGRFFGVETEKIKQGIENYTPSNNRSQYVETQLNKLIVDAYNANPSSMSEAIRNFAQIKAENKTLILGDMLELGKNGTQEHQNIVHLLEENHFAQVFLVGENFISTNNNFFCFANTDQLIQHIQTQPLENQFILLKGSRGVRLEKVLEWV